MSKIAVLVPGIGYTCDRPLLYFAGKLAQNSGYQIIWLGFRHLGGKKNLIGNEKKMKKVFEHALEQTDEQLDIDELTKAEEVLFISKSVGTVAAAAYEAGHRKKFAAAGTDVRHIYFTPVAGTFAFMRPESGIAFHGTADPWVEHALVVNACREKNVPLYITDNANHSLETGDVMEDLETLRKTMQIVAAFINQDNGTNDLPAAGKEVCHTQVDTFAAVAGAEKSGKDADNRAKTSDSVGNEAPSNARRVVRIEEDDYGCEELPEGQEPQVRVILEDEKGDQTAVKASDRLLRERGIDEGDLVTVDTEGELQKVN
ncbi:MAG: hypothetical protein SPL65_05075 [Lachnospiraceae bacterium]|nr:hypothetical protein [Lachnospiraceae bacterium]